MVSRKVDIVVLTVIGQELSAVKSALDIQETPDNRIKISGSNTTYLYGEIFSERIQKSYSLALGCIGSPGNPNSSSATTEAISEFEPKLLVLVGIAAGIKGTLRLGEVVFAERIVGYESATLDRLKDGIQIVKPRTEMVTVPNGINQSVVFYLADKNQNQNRLNSSFTSIGGNFPTLSNEDRSHLQERNIIQEIEIDRCTIASGEKLIKDPTVLQNIRDNLHGRVKAGEMEATGFAGACNRMNKDWLVIRGVSDFGDPYKSDVFQPLASQTAATVLADFLKHGIDLPSNHQHPERGNNEKISSVALEIKLPERGNNEEISSILMASYLCFAKRSKEAQ
ncbi:hypothetical protein [Chamaesiphon sp. OTE_75_metabat_556]|uniref:5'-methylthioadenosine/S-adenosylhomocysteine nucleosidase family protein n=1 Tax=Chamaesiphon sp. OTE_75_metabat_556 TaxID=2964692 RepID=UPI00286A7D4D|nr:hypothetical protein [Chamaesiphon sp. OTE_75_metabat_556]